MEGVYKYAIPTGSDWSDISTKLTQILDKSAATEHLQWLQASSSPQKMSGGGDSWSNRAKKVVNNGLQAAQAVGRGVVETAQTVHSTLRAADPISDEDDESFYTSSDFDTDSDEEQPVLEAAPASDEPLASKTKTQEQLDQERKAQQLIAAYGNLTTFAEWMIYLVYLEETSENESLANLYLKRFHTLKAVSYTHLTLPTKA